MPSCFDGRQRMGVRAIGEHELAPRQRFDGLRQRRIGLKRRAVDVVDETQKFGRLDAMFPDQAGERRAIGAVIVFLQRPRGNGVEAEYDRSCKAVMRASMRGQRSLSGG